MGPTHQIKTSRITMPMAISTRRLKINPKIRLMKLIAGATEVRGRLTLGRAEVDAQDHSWERIRQRVRQRAASRQPGGSWPGPRAYHLAPLGPCLPGRLRGYADWAPESRRSY